MKKYIIVAFSVLLVVFLTACGKTNQVKCSKEATEEGITMKAEVVADLDSNNKISDVSLTYDFSDKSTAEAFCDAIKESNESNKEASVSCSGTKITIKGLDNLDADEEEDSEKLVGKTKDDFIKLAKEDGFTCE